MSASGAIRARFIGFGQVQIDGQRYEYDVVLDRGRVGKRHKGPSKALRERYGHTPLTAAEEIPWTCQRLIIGTGADGALPVDDSVNEEARRRHVEVVAMPTEEACELISTIPRDEVAAVLHVTC